MPSTPRTCSVKEAAQVLGVSVATIHKAAAAGQLPHIRLGRRVLILRSPLERVLRGDVETQPRANCHVG